MSVIKGGYLIFIILLIGLNYLRADEDTTEAISDYTETIAITTQVKKTTPTNTHINAFIDS